jgi:hypothetical protein
MEQSRHRYINRSMELQIEKFIMKKGVKYMREGRGEKTLPLTVEFLYWQRLRFQTTSFFLFFYFSEIRVKA